MAMRSKFVPSLSPRERRCRPDWLAGHAEFLKTICDMRLITNFPADASE